ncbi:hypothetical protein [Ligilactobacillus equi]|uniref:Uncharacterized protein n=1 Tax=Ligilactobacillus equi DSM 15833 = JCM 10991 TaxID=1423740 RepID=A0A0R1TKL0_9LACO|nr:hypothetical protein [Ligilactobacillus equi]KRL79203.1 hypothetical protein FC36_GL000856 [Ligilactobacillus equi DSM 15833 = JCM 10991]
MSKSDLQYGLLISRLASESYEALTNAIEDAGVELVKVSDSKAIVIPIIEELDSVFQDIVFSLEDEGNSLRIKFVVYNHQDTKYYGDGLEINRQALIEIGGDAEKSQDGFTLEDMAELIGWFLDNQELANADIDAVFEKNYSSPEGGELLSSSVGVPEPPESSTDATSELDDLLSNSVKDSENEVQTPTEEVVHSRKEQREQTKPEVVDTSIKNIPEFDNTLLKRATEAVEQAEGKPFVPEYDPFIKGHLLDEITAYSNRVNDEWYKTILSVYNRYLEVKSRVENVDLREMLDKAKSELEESLADIDIRQKQTNAEIQSKYQREYDERKRAYVDSMKPSLEAEFDSKNLDALNKNIEINQAKSARLNDEERKKHKQNYEDYVVALKNKAVNNALDDLSIEDILEAYDKENAKEIKKLEELAKQFDFDQSEQYKALEAEKEKSQDEVKQAKLKIALMQENMQNLRDTFEKEVQAETASNVANKTRKLQEENTELSSQNAKKQRELDAQNDSIIKMNEAHEQALKDKDEQISAIMENLRAKENELKEQKQKYQALEAKNFQEMQQNMIMQQQAQAQTQQMQVQQMQQAQLQAQTESEKPVENKPESEKKSSSWASNLLKVTASIAIIGGLGIGGYAVLHNLTSSEQQSEVVASTSHSNLNKESKSKSDKQSSTSGSSSTTSDGSSSTAESTTSVKEPSDKENTIYKVSSNGTAVGNSFNKTLPNGETYSILRTGENVGQYTDENGTTKTVFITD